MPGPRGSAGARGPAGCPSRRRKAPASSVACRARKSLKVMRTRLFRWMDSAYTWLVITAANAPPRTNSIKTRRVKRRIRTKGPRFLLSAREGERRDKEMAMKQFAALLRRDNQPVRYLVVDDSVFARKNLIKMIEMFGGEVAGEAGDGLTAIAEFNRIRPDIVLMDIT